MKKLSLTIVVLFMFCTFTFAQEKEKSAPYKNWEIGINAGVANFSGEYNMYKEARFNHFNHWNSDMNLGFGALVKKNFSHVFALEAAWNYSNLSGSWKYDNREMPDFKTEVNEYDLNTVWNINNLFSKNKFERKIYWYAKLGLGASHVWKKVGATSSHGQHWKLPTIPLGTGVALRLNDNFNLNMGTQWSWVNTDRLDSRRTDMTSENINPKNSEADIFGTKLYTYAGISFSFGKKNKPEPIVETPKPEAKPEAKPELRSEPKTMVQIVKPAVIGNVYKEYFAFDKWSLNDKATVDLNALARDMNENMTVNVEIKSHTDSRGPASYNMKLSEKRGKSVIDYLAGKGVNPTRINAQAFGETQLVNKCAENVPCTSAEHALNRRTESIVIE
jgi:outer membrane protein OmpA-like peptidoglycan-associated protein